MIRILILVSLLGCGKSNGGILPRECGAPCNSSDECRNTGTACGVCFGGSCSRSLPAEPISDAGIDSPTK